MFLGALIHSFILSPTFFIHYPSKPLPYPFILFSYPFHIFFFICKYPYPFLTIKSNFNLHIQFQFYFHFGHPFLSFYQFLQFNPLDHFSFKFNSFSISDSVRLCKVHEISKTIIHFKSHSNSVHFLNHNPYYPFTIHYPFLQYNP